MMRWIVETLDGRPGRTARRLSALVALEAAIAMTIWVNTAGVAARTNAVLDVAVPAAAHADYFITRWAPLDRPPAPGDARDELAQLGALPGVAGVAQVDLGARRAHLRRAATADREASAPFDARVVRLSGVKTGESTAAPSFIGRRGWVIGPELADALFDAPGDAVGARIEDLSDGRTQVVIDVQGVVPTHVGASNGDPVLLESVEPWWAAEADFILSLDGAASQNDFAAAFDRLAAEDTGRIWHRAARPAMWARSARHLRLLETFLLVVSGGVAVMLIVSTYGVSAYLLAARRRDIAVVRALGWRRRDLVRRQVLESVLWVLLGGVLGVLPAWLWHSGMVATLSYADLPFWPPMALALLGLLLIATGTALASARRVATVSPALATSEV